MDVAVQPVAHETLTPDRFGSVLSLSNRGFHRVAYVEWGDPASERVAVCVHGLSRQGRDFDTLAAALAARGWRVICPDLAGRGRSDWLKDPQEYTLPQYVRDLTAVVARLDVASVDWIGTSLGGLVGMVVAAQAASPIRRLVVNDVGPFLPWQALQRLGNSIRNAPQSYPDLAAAVASYRVSLAPFGALSDQQWRHLAEHSLIELGGLWRRRADPDITASFRTGWLFNLSLWNYWDAIRCPTLVLRGTESDLLQPATTREMTQRGPRAEIVEFPHVGHAPALMDDYQIDPILRWLDAG